MKSRTNKLALFAMTAGIKAPARLAAHQALGKQIGKFMLPDTGAPLQKQRVRQPALREAVDQTLKACL